MFFKNRAEAGRLLAEKLTKYGGKNVIVLGLPRGGVVPAFEIAKALKAPLDIVLAHKIGHPHSPEYAIGAISESGHLLITSAEAKFVDPRWLAEEKELQIRELAHKRQLFGRGKKAPSLKDKIVILVDDGIATGSTMKVAIKEIQSQQPQKLIVAVAVSPDDTAREIAASVDEFIALKVASGADFMGAVGAHYEHFPQVENDEVIALLEGL